TTLFRSLAAERPCGSAPTRYGGSGARSPCQSVPALDCSHTQALASVRPAFHLPLPYVVADPAQSLGGSERAAVAAARGGEVGSCGRRGVICGCGWYCSSCRVGARLHRLPLHRHHLTISPASS